MPSLTKISLTSLPIEILNGICSYLEQPEWAALRLSCRSLYAKSSDAFADRYFRSICFIATSEGIRQLEELAQSEAVRVRVRQLWMIPTVFEGRHGQSLTEFRRSHYGRTTSDVRKTPSHVGKTPSHVWKSDDALLAHYAIYQAIEADHLALLQSTTLGSRLHTCFASFRNLESVGLKHYATNFLLDRRQADFRYLGLQELRDQVEYVYHQSGMDLLQWHQVAKVNSLALSRVLLGLNESSQDFRALNTCGANFCGSTSPSLPLTDEQYNSVLLKLGNLEHLHMCICYDEDDLDCPPNSNTYIDLFISVAPQLTTLVFSQWYRSPREMGEQFLELSQNIRFTRLRELHLHWIEIGFESFKLFLNTTKGTLDSLSLELVTLKTNTALSTNSEPSGWEQIWESLGAELSLKSFYMGNIGYRRRKVMIQGPDELAEPTYSVTFNAYVTDICFNDWIRQLKPIILRSFDISTRSYPDSLRLRKPRSNDPPASGTQIHERRPKPLGLGPKDIRSLMTCYPGRLRHT
ncbi:hypothetical protein PMG11_00017 [Penicillium brasilianum]|uniref:F-box domain-containing protein n=1 Tax=Penicillium brasilianum TaxID=104259 RepID=A0A0F7TCX0_PENBI|nr:hypothetical protein PMG11_00017 [Penicillium brasilianum]